jgi:hypothetical protein
MDGPRRIVQDNRLPITSTRAHTAARGKDVIFVSSSPSSSTAPLTPTARPVPDSSRDSSDVIASSPQPSVQVSKKRKAFIDSPSSQSDDLYIANPKPKRAKAGTGSRKAAAARSEQKAKQASVKGKGKETVGKEKGKEKEKERPARSRQPKKATKSVAFIEDEDSSSSDDKQPPVTRPKPKPAYRGASALQESLPESQKVAVSVPAGKHVVKPQATAVPLPMGSNSVPIVPVGPTTDSRTPAVPTVPASAMSPPAPVVPPASLAHTTPPVPRAPPPPIAPPAPTLAIPSGEPSHRIPDAHGAAPFDSEGQYPPFGPRPPRDYAADERNHFYHRQPPVRGMDAYSSQPPMPYQNSGQSMYPGDGDIPAERYRFQGDYYGYGPPSREYYAPPYPHVMQPRGQSPYIARPPAPYHQQPPRNPHLQPDTAAAPRGMAMSNVMASSSSLPPSDNTKSS